MLTRLNTDILVRKQSINNHWSQNKVPWMILKKNHLVLINYKRIPYFWLWVILRAVMGMMRMVTAQSDTARDIMWKLGAVWRLDCLAQVEITSRLVEREEMINTARGRMNEEVGKGWSILYSLELSSVSVVILSITVSLYSMSVGTSGAQMPLITVSALLQAVAVLGLFIQPQLCGNYSVSISMPALLYLFTWWPTIKMGTGCMGEGRGEHGLGNVWTR